MTGRFSGDHRGRLQKLPKTKLRRNVVLTVAWPRRDGRLLTLRMVIRYIAEKKSCTYLLTNLPADRFDGDTVAALYRLRWQIELVFKEWKSYASLHALQTEHPAIVEGFIWASLCAAFLKRALAHWAQLAIGRPISTRIVAMAGSHILPRIADWVSQNFPQSLLLHLLEFIRENALRTHPERDRRYARRLVGLDFAGTTCR